jgi:hypothetical protein
MCFMQASLSLAGEHPASGPIPALLLKKDDGDALDQQPGGEQADADREPALVLRVGDAAFGRLPGIGQARRLSRDREKSAARRWW